MRGLAEYSIEDWVHLRPLTEGGKQLANDLVQKRFLNARLDALAKFLQENQNLRGKNILTIVAFEQPDVLDFSLKMAGRHVVDATVIVFDNSRGGEARREIERICRSRNVPYLGLPPNPTSQENRSHGMAMTWIWHNFVKAIRPAISGFIDHDVIPLQKVELTKHLENQPFYGVPNVGECAWSLWAGFCFYGFVEVGSLSLNFLNDSSRGVDTGGRNWGCLYKAHDYRKFQFADLRIYDVRDDSERVSRQLEIIDESWLHVGGPNLRPKGRRNSNFYARIRSTIDEGADWPQLQAEMGGTDKIRLIPKEDISKRPRLRKSSFESLTMLQNHYFKLRSMQKDKGFASTIETGQSNPTK
jgi:hypothetical protein